MAFVTLASVAYCVYILWKLGPCIVTFGKSGSLHRHCHRKVRWRHYECLLVIDKQIFERRHNGWNCESRYAQPQTNTDGFLSESVVYQLPFDHIHSIAVGYNKYELADQLCDDSTLRIMPHMRTQQNPQPHCSSNRQGHKST